MIDIAGQASEVTIQASVIIQTIITFLLAGSMESMWNLLNVMQVLSYMKFYARWPGFIDDMFQKLDDTITLDPAMDSIFEYGMTKFELANATLSDESLRDAGVQDPTLFKSLGIFGLALVGLGVAVLVFLIL